jgi:hypothetical protein
LHIYKLKEVFAPGGMPSVTYVGREHLELEQKIFRAVQRGYAFNVITGPTKSGKSVLCHKVLDASKLVTMEGGQISSIDDFWQQLSHRLRVAAGVSESETENEKVGAEVSVGWNIAALLNLKAKAEVGSGRESSRQYVTAAKIACIESMLASEAILLIDDFHYLEPAVQKAVIQSFKAPVMKGLTVFLLAVPHRAFDPITVENEVEGRFKHIAIPTWDMADLELIAERGFPALNIDSPGEIVHEMGQQSARNPLLMQEICAELCLENSITETQRTRTAISGGALPNAYREIAESKGFPKFERLRKGPQARKLREQRQLVSGEEEDIYSLIMMALAKTGPKAKTTYDELRTEMRALIHSEGKMPQKNEITSALSHMTMIAKKDIKGEPALEWVKETNELVITDPFLIFYMRHADLSAKHD